MQVILFVSHNYFIYQLSFRKKKVFDQSAVMSLITKSTELLYQKLNNIEFACHSNLTSKTLCTLKIICKNQVHDWQITQKPFFSIIKKNKKKLLKKITKEVEEVIYQKKEVKIRKVFHTIFFFLFGRVQKKV